ncbi:MAG: DUF4256 domain-containing protein [Candidatus Altimarinota bacterium]
MSKAYGKPALSIPPTLDRQTLVKTLENLVDKGIVSAELVQAEINELTSGIRRKSLMASKISLEKELTKEQLENLISNLKTRFDQNINRHKGIEWSRVDQRLKNAEAKKLWSLSEMERTGGEPDILKVDERTGEVIFYDCAVSSPRANCVYDGRAEQDVRKMSPQAEFNGNAVDIITNMGLEFIDEQEYRFMQTLVEFDHLRTSSWIKTPLADRREDIAKVGERIGDSIRIDESNPRRRNVAIGVRGMLRI